VRETARKNGKLKFTALLHHVTVGLLRESYYRLKRQAAPGVDGVTWQEYGQGLEDRLADLHGRIHRGAYRAQPSRRVWIPKPDGRQRPLGIAALEDKVVQHAVGKVLNQIWEEDFLGFSYGFRPGRGPQDALDALWVGIVRKKVNWIVDLDIRSFFDKLQHDWLVKFVEHRIGDRRITRLIQKRCIGRRWANVLPLSSRKFERNCIGACTPAFRKPWSGYNRWCGGISSITRFRATGSD
jgi:retron-type reverse transcriptase